MADQTIVIRVNAVTGQAQAQIAAFGRTMGTTAGQMDSAAKQAQARMQAFGSAAATFGKIVTLGVAGGLALSAKAAIDFESSFAGVRKTLDATEPQFAALAQDMRDLAKEIPVNVNELNRIAELGGQLGVSVEGIEGFTETIAQVGVTTTLAIEDAAIGFARLANILGVAEGDFDRIGSTMVDLGNNFATTEDQILTFALRIAPVGETVGLTADQILSLATAFSSVGVPAERGGTAVQKTFIEIASAVKGGGEDLEDFAKIAGVSAEEFATVFEQDAARAFQLFLEGLNGISQAGGDVFAALNNLGLGGTRTTQSILALANAGDLLSRTLTTGETAWNQNTALAEEAGKRFETTASQIQLAKNEIADLGITIGENLLPLLGDMASGVGDLIEGFKQLDGPVGGALKAFLLLVAGWTTVQFVGGKLVNMFGFLMPKAMQKTVLAAGAMKAALGATLVGAVALGISALVNLGNQAAETQAKIESLVEAIPGGGDEVSAAFIAGFSDRIKQDLDELGIAYETFARAIQGDGTAIEIVMRKVAAAQDELSASTGDLFEMFSGKNDQLRRVLETLGTESDNYATALERQEQQLRSLAEEAYLETLAQGYEKVELAEKKALRGGVPEQNLIDLADAAEIAAQELEALEDAYEYLDAAFDASTNFVDAVVDLAEAHSELNDATEPTFEQMRAVRDAFVGVQRAARDLGPDGIQPAINQLDAMRLMGLLTEEQYIEFLNILLTMQPVAENFAGGADIVINNMELVEEAAQIAGQSVGGFMNMLLGLNDAMFSSLGNLSQFARGIQLAGQIMSIFGLAAGGVFSNVGNVLGQIAGLVDRLTGLRSGFVSIGADIADAVGVGVSGGGGGGGVSDVVEEEIEDALEVAQRQVDAFMGAIDANRRYAESVRDVAEAEEELNRLLEEQKELPDLIADAEERLRIAREEANRVTLDEQLAIQIAEENLARARLAFAQGRISDVELAIAERDLEEAREESIADTDEVIDIEEELEDLRKRELELAEDLAEAEWDLVDAQLSLIEAQINLVEAGRDFRDVGEEGVEIFRELAEQVGLSEDAIRSLIDLGLEVGGAFSPILGVTGDTAYPEEDDSTLIGGTTTSPQNTYTVQAGDTLGAIAASLGVTLDHLIGLNATVVNSITGISRSLDPNLIFPGDLLHFAMGGIVPGMLGQPRLVVAHGGEEVLPPVASMKRHQLHEQPIVVENLHIKGVFDPTRPQEWNKIMRAMRDDLEYDRRSRTVV